MWLLRVAQRWLFFKEDLLYPTNSALCLSSMQDRQQETVQDSATGHEGLSQLKALVSEGDQGKGWEQK